MSEINKILNSKQVLQKIKWASFLIAKKDYHQIMELMMVQAINVHLDLSIMENKGNSE